MKVKLEVNVSEECSAKTETEAKVKVKNNQKLIESKLKIINANESKSGDINKSKVDKHWCKTGFYSST